MEVTCNDVVLGTGATTTTVPEPNTIGDPMPLERRAWECPRCGDVNGPHVDKCGCPSFQLVPTPLWQEPIGNGGTITVVPGDCGCDVPAGGTCMNAACPRAVKVIC